MMPIGPASAALIGLMLTSVTVQAQTWDTREESIRIDGESRTYLVFGPDTRPETPLPAMIVMHGGLGNAEGVDRLYGMNEIAEREGFFAVYPNGPEINNRLMRNRRTWNAGLCCGRAVEDNVDDVAFLSAMIDALIEDHNVDPRRVYASGMSNGAMMAYRLVCELPNAIAAAIPVAGTLVLDDCDGGENIPILHIHGADDDNVPVAGGIGPRAIVDIDYLPLFETFALLAARRGCSEPETSVDPTGIEQTTFRCADGAPIVVKILPGVGHTWPGAEPRRLQRNRYDGDFSASEAAWEFARAYSK
jgi:polyhydroxybutyrate depolymerase